MAKQMNIDITHQTPKHWHWHGPSSTQTLTSITPFKAPARDLHFKIFVAAGLKPCNQTQASIVKRNISSNPCLDSVLSSILYKSPPWQLQSQLSPWKYLLLWKRMCSNCKQQWQWQQVANAKPKNHIGIPPNIHHLLHSLSCPHPVVMVSTSDGAHGWVSLPNKIQTELNSEFVRAMCHRSCSGARANISLSLFSIHMMEYLPLKDSKETAWIFFPMPLWYKNSWREASSDASRKVWSWFTHEWRKCWAPGLGIHWGWSCGKRGYQLRNSPSHTVPACTEFLHLMMSPVHHHHLCCPLQQQQQQQGWHQHPWLLTAWALTLPCLHLQTAA